MPPNPDNLSALDRLRIVRVAEAAKLRGESPYTVRRHLRGKEVRLGPRAVGFRLGDVLALPPESATP